MLGKNGGGEKIWGVEGGRVLSMSRRRRRRSWRRSRNSGSRRKGADHARSEMQMGCCCSRGASSRMMLTLIKMLKDVEKTMSVLRFLTFFLQEGA